MFEMSLSSFLLIGSLLSTQVLGLGGRPYSTERFNRRATESWAANETFTHGPIIDESFADPCLIKVGDTWWAFATSHVDVHIQVATSPDFKVWTKLVDHDALPTVPGWVNQKAPNTWAPSVNLLDDGTFLMYYSAATISSVGGGHHCIGAARSKTVEGPYTPINSTLVCPSIEGGAIDAEFVKDWEQKGSGWGYNGHTEIQDMGSDSWKESEWWGGGKGGQLYLVYKVDGNSIGHGGACGNTVQPIVPTPIKLQKVANDGITLQGGPTVILDNIGIDDDGITEAPSLVKAPNGKYFLFFSTGCFSTNHYTQHFATADTIDGPYTRQPPMYQTGDLVDGKALVGPGGGSIYWDAHHFLFHADFPTSGNRACYEALVDLIGDMVEDGQPPRNSTAKR